MKQIIISQSIIQNKRKEFLSSLNFEWFQYSSKLNFHLIPLPFSNTLSYLKNIKIDGLIISGGNGNDLYKFSKKEKNLMRDKFEIKLINFCIKRKIPILAICRGFQLIAKNHGSKLNKINNHVKKNHKVILKNQMLKYKKKIINVNSFHNFGITQISKNFTILARHKDGSIEMGIDKKNKILGMMFHPERKSKDQHTINRIVRNFFQL